MSGWTFDTIKEYIDAKYNHVMELKSHDLVAMRDRIDANERITQQRFDAVYAAVDKAEVATDKRLEVLNELRAVVSDQRGSFITRIEAGAKIDSTVKDVGTLQTRLDKLEGRGSGLNAGWGYLVGAIATVAVVFDIMSRLVK